MRKKGNFEMGFYVLFKCTKNYRKMLKRITYLKRCVLSKTIPQHTEPNMPAKTIATPILPASIS